MERGSKEGEIGGPLASFVVGYGPPAAIMLRKGKTSGPTTRLLSSFFSIWWVSEKNESNWEKKWREGQANQRKDKPNANDWMPRLDWLVVGYGRWPSCSAPTHKSTHYPFIDLFGLLALSFFLHPINQRSELVDWKDGRREWERERHTPLLFSSFFRGPTQ